MDLRDSGQNCFSKFTGKTSNTELSLSVNVFSCLWFYVLIFYFDATFSFLMAFLCIFIGFIALPFWTLCSSMIFASDLRKNGLHRGGPSFSRRPIGRQRAAGGVCATWIRWRDIGWCPRNWGRRWEQQPGRRTGVNGDEWR